MPRSVHVYVPTEERHREAARAWLREHTDHAVMVSSLADAFAEAEERGWAHLAEKRTQLVEELKIVLLGTSEGNAGLLVTSAEALRDRADVAAARVAELEAVLDRVRCAVHDVSRP